jgi:hypothetical protein
MIKERSDNESNQQKCNVTLYPKWNPVCASGPFTNRLSDALVSQYKNTNIA